MKTERYGSDPEDDFYFRAVPETAFEESILRTLLFRALEDCRHAEIEVSLSSEPSIDGWFGMFAGDRNTDWVDLSGRVFAGRVCVARNGHAAPDAAPKYCWEFEGQQNYLPHLPFVELLAA